MPNKDAVGVIHELRRFRDDIEEILNAIGDKTLISEEETLRLQELLKSLKSRLREAAAKHGFRNEFESAYFEPAVRNAAAHLRIATNSHPIKSNWLSALLHIRLDITYCLSQLEKQFPFA
jgi:hypothetical protein